MKKLDRSKPFATTHGDATHSFEQDGVSFDAAGNEVVEKGARAAPAPKAVEKSEVDRQLEEGDEAAKKAAAEAAARHAAAEKFGAMKVAEIQKHLKKAGVHFETDANKDRLVELAIEHSVK